MMGEGIWWRFLVVWGWWDDGRNAGFLKGTPTPWGDFYGNGTFHFYGFVNLPTFPNPNFSQLSARINEF
jgi:hypothetical protein